MATCRVIEVRQLAGRTHERRVYKGKVAPEIAAGRKTLQVRPFGRRYHVNGQVLEEDRDRRVRGVSCRFELVMP